LRKEVERMKRDRQVTCRIPEELYLLLERDAKAQHRTIAGMLHHQLMQLYGQELHEQER
jgi:hypothetical protein